MQIDRLELERHAQVLLCPRCRSNNLHQTDIDVWIRPDGQRKPGEAVHVGDTGLRSRRTADGFVAERQDVRICFWCELCQLTSMLVMWQHEGQTLQSWWTPEMPPSDSSCL